MLVSIKWQTNHHGAGCLGTERWGSPGREVRVQGSCGAEAVGRRCWCWLIQIHPGERSGYTVMVCQSNCCYDWSPARMITDMLRCYSVNTLAWCGETGSRGKLCRHNGPWPRWSRELQCEPLAVKQEEKEFVEHPNILFGQLVVLGQGPSFPLAEFRERAQV